MTTQTPMGARSARDSIAGLVHRYADAVVRRDVGQWAACWAEDARWSLAPGREVVGRAAIVDLWGKAMATFEAVVQNVMNGDVDVDEPARTGKGRWYVHEHFRLRSGDAGILLAHYDDTYTAAGGEWLFDTRALTVHYQGPPDLSAPFQNAAAP